MIKLFVDLLFRFIIKLLLINGKFIFLVNFVIKIFLFLFIKIEFKLFFKLNGFFVFIFLKNVIYLF